MTKAFFGIQRALLFANASQEMNVDGSMINRWFTAPELIQGIIPFSQ